VTAVKKEIRGRGQIRQHAHWHEVVSDAARSALLLRFSELDNSVDAHTHDDRQDYK
jgi:hypothetical protein